MPTFVSLPDGLELKPYQQSDLDRWMELPSPRVLWDCSEMGLGKSVSAVVAGKACNHSRILVVSPKAMRLEWQAEFTKWWPEREMPAELSKGFARKATSRPEKARLAAKLANPIHIISPELLPKLVALHRAGAASAYGQILPYDYCIFDEFHEFRSWFSLVIKAMVMLRTMYPEMELRCLSGTPLGSDPLRAWAWLKVSEPHKWGTLKKGEQIPLQFRKLYGERQESDYAFSGYTYAGVNKERLPQFKASISHLIMRHTARELGDQLPETRFELKRYSAEISAAHATADWAQAAIQTEAVAIFTRNLEPLNDIEAELRLRRISFVRIEEYHTRNERVALVESARREGPYGYKVILGTTGLMSTGVNYLANIRLWMLAQPSENPVEIQQLSKRFSRLSSEDKLPRTGYLLYREGDEFEAQKMLAKRLKTDNALIVPSKDALELERILEGRSKSSLLDTLAVLGQAMMMAGDDEEEDDT